MGRIKYGVEGKTVHHQPDTVKIYFFPVPTTILSYYKNTMLSVKVVLVNRILYLVSVSKNIYYGTIKALYLMKILLKEDEVKRVNRMYAVRGFHAE